MQLIIKFKDDVPFSLAADLINNLYNQCALFDMVSELRTSFDEGEEERLMAVQNSRMKQIK